MAPTGIGPTARVWHASTLALVVALLAAACSSSAATAVPAASIAAATNPPSAAPTSPPTPAPTLGPATQKLTLAGPAGASGALSNAAIRCSFPSLDGGPLINVIGQPTDPNLSVYVNVQAGKVTVRYDSGPGSTYVERDFAGTGVTTFDPAKGAILDSPLTEVSTTGAHGTLGVLTSIGGTIDCGNQMPGSSTLAISGSTAKGDFGGAPTSVNVECVTNTSGKNVSVLGIAPIGAAPALLVIFISPGTLSVSSSNAAGYVGFFRNTPTMVATLSVTGAQVDGDLVEQNPAAGTKAHTIHVTGDVVCGTYVGG